MIRQCPTCATFPLLCEFHGAANAAAASDVVVSPDAYMAPEQESKAVSPRLSHPSISAWSTSVAASIQEIVYEGKMRRKDWPRCKHGHHSYCGHCGKVAR